ncbi:C45 family autoproteolytic acyltransferase/hydolase [Limnoglobus roseus]|uniref:Choloylglycine hydrolase n=1 Tax=Limnoglobus roseus TaxID=2598579 RepID=A0A5C1AI99_9BACT|nr:C45 family peptidase [Limnoglobus roseus]QEL18901.1 choloylglycine hydrolase [Limnoglobus roseus]
MTFCTPHVRTIVLLLALATPPRAAEPFRFPEAKQGPGELRYVEGVPVLTVAGTPDEIGAQVYTLGVNPAAKLLDYPKDILKQQVPVQFVRDQAWAGLLKKGEGLLGNFPKHHQDEFDAMVKAGGDRDRLLAANTMFDLKNADLKEIFGCSSLIVDADRSATGRPMFGRNLDFFPCGYLHDYGLVTVYKPKGMRPFLTIGYPGCVGSFSGMNAAGLSLASHEVFNPAVARKFNAGGVPFALAYRRVLEECDTVAEAVKLLETIERTTSTMVVLCGKEGGVIVEVSPDAVAVRKPVNGLCATTNHFTTKDLATKGQANTYKTLDRLALLSEDGGGQKVGTDELHRRLKATGQGELTLQTMIFEPAAAKLHLAMGKGPSTELKLRTLDVKALLK